MRRQIALNGSTITGWACAIERRRGTATAYVAIPKDHPWHNKDVESINATRMVSFWLSDAKPAPVGDAWLLGVAVTEDYSDWDMIALADELAVCALGAMHESYGRGAA